MKRLNKTLCLLAISLLVGVANPISAQTVIGNNLDIEVDYLTPKQYEIGGIEFQNAENFDTRMILLVAGLQVGDKINIPGDKISTAIDNLWKQGLFEDIEISVTRIYQGKAFLMMKFKERPKLFSFSFHGIKGDDEKKLREQLKLTTGDIVTENLLTTSANRIKSFYMEKGFTNVAVRPQAIPDTTGGKKNQVNISFFIDRGKRVKIDSMIFAGNTNVPTKKLLLQMKNTHDVHYFKTLFVWTKPFWQRSKYNEANFHEDLDNIITYYNKLGYRDARITRDTVFPVPSEQLTISSKKKAKQDRLKVKVNIYEGQPFYFRNITFTGNTIYSEELLARHLRINKGDPYNKTTLETNLTYNPSGTDITSLYMDNGYLFFRAVPIEVGVENDSIDIEIRITEGKQARIRNVSVQGNTLTNDKVIMRELHTRPGDLFSREAIIRSRRELVTLGFFKEETLDVVPKPNPTDGTVDIVYKVEEGNSSTLTLQGGYGNRMFVGQFGIQLNNFSARNIFNRDAWAPLPAGDGQKLGLNLISNGTFYNAANLSFTEPWLGGKRPQAFGISIFYNNYNNGYLYKKDDYRHYQLQIMGAALSLGKRLKWPDDYFALSQGLTYKRYNLDNYAHLTSSFTDGQANELSYSITLSRNSFDSPHYTRSGSEISISGQITPPFSLISGKDFSTATNEEKFKWLEYYKINVRGSWMLNLVGDIVLNARVRFGYMGYYNQDIGLCPFGRYYVGGSGLNTFVMDGREVIPLRGYKDEALSPDGGASVFDRYTLELRQPIIESAASTIWVLGFLEGGNSWKNIREFQPFKVYNSAGVGVRLIMNPLGLIGIDWGYGFDGPERGGQFHFIISQSID